MKQPIVWHLHKSQTDATINANAGTNNGATDAPGMIGGARHFQADSSQFIEVNYSSSLALRNMTFSAWTKQDVPGNATGIIGTRVNGDQTFDLKWMSGGLHGDIGDGTTWFSTSADYNVTPEPEKWFYVTYVVGTDGYKIYLDGDSVKAEAFVGTPALMVAGESLRIGHTGYGVEYFSGVIDEPRIDKVKRSSDWIKLSYANQNAKQSLVTLLMTNRCVASFSAPNDTTLNEGAALVINPTTACASSIAWSVVSGPAITIPDPQAKSLMLKLPRVTRDTTLVLHLSVTNPAGVQQKDIKVNIKEASPYSAMTWVWTIPVLYADTASFEGGMLLKSG